MKTFVMLILVCSFLFFTKESKLTAFDNDEEGMIELTTTSSTNKSPFVDLLPKPVLVSQQSGLRQIEKKQNKEIYLWQYLYFWIGVACAPLLVIIDKFWPSPKEQA